VVSGTDKSLEPCFTGGSVVEVALLTATYFLRVLREPARAWRSAVMTLGSHSPVRLAMALGGLLADRTVLRQASTNWGRFLGGTEVVHGRTRRDSPGGEGPLQSNQFSCLVAVVGVTVVWSMANMFQTGAMAD
jgi:hypothetical protein